MVHTSNLDPSNGRLTLTSSLDYSVLRAGQSTTPEISAVATSAVWMTLCLLFWGIPFFYFPPVWIRWHKVDIESRGHRVMGIVAIVACFGYLLGQ